MEKYKLKKDTFFYKAGTICTLTKEGHLVVDDSQVTLLYEHELKYHPELLEEWFEKIGEKKYGGRVPKGGDEYWFLSPDGKLCRDTIATGYDTICTTDAHRFESGSAFWTYKEAEKEFKRRNAYVILKEDTKGFVPDWNNSYETKHAVYYDHINEKFDLLFFGANQYGADLFFATEEDVKASIEAHRQQWLDYLGIEEEK